MRGSVVKVVAASLVLWIVLGVLAPVPGNASSVQGTTVLGNAALDQVVGGGGLGCTALAGIGGGLDVAGLLGCIPCGAVGAIVSLGALACHIFT